MLAYVENGVAMAFDRGSAAWTFELDWWGVCGQGPDEVAALADLRRRVGEEVVVAERIDGDELVFARDQVPCTEAERQRTLEILADTRASTSTLLRSCTDAVLDWDDPERELPTYARWRTVRQLAWHLADTESRYYLPSTGLGYREPLPDSSTSSRPRPSTYARRSPRCPRTRQPKGGPRSSCSAASRGTSAASSR